MAAGPGGLVERVSEIQPGVGLSKEHCVRGQAAGVSGIAGRKQKPMLISLHLNIFLEMARGFVALPAGKMEDDMSELCRNLAFFEI